MAENALQLPVDPFRLVARIAHGGMATIYVGALGGERVAVKLLHPHLAEDPHIGGMFLHEAQLASRLEHPNVVHVMDHGEHPVHGTFIVMEYVEGGDLATLIEASQEAEQLLPIGVVLRIVIDLCRGLEAAHSLNAEDGAPLNLIHRDVSPHNLLVGTDGVARLTDFGIAKSDARYTLTSPGQLRGKLAYMAPEQLAHEDELDARVDVFSAGVLLFEALTGRRLFKGEDEISTINKVLLERVPPASDHRAELAPLDAVVAKALAREREDRWPSAKAMADALEEASQTLGGPAEREAVKATVANLLREQLAKRASKIRAGSLTNSGIFVSRDTPSGASASGTAEPTTRKQSPWLLPLIAVLVLGAGGLGAAIAWRSREPVPELPVAVQAEAPQAPQARVEPPQTDAVREEPAAMVIPEAPTFAPSEDTPEPASASPRTRPSRRRRPSLEAAAVPDAPANVATGAPTNAAIPDPPTNAEARNPGDDLYPNPFRD